MGRWLSPDREKVKKTDETDSLSLCSMCMCLCGCVCFCTDQRTLYVGNLDQRFFLSFFLSFCLFLSVSKDNTDKALGFNTLR